MSAASRIGSQQLVNPGLNKDLRLMQETAQLLPTITALMMRSMHGRRVACRGL